ncbi:chaperone protein [Cryptococcus neoformans]|uniref:Mitochondrial import inner membrane translocase subunit TIM14 n=3 Tax=Cryptococcus neoformans species complex TaxID=1897064 RepID=Q5KPM7_CRYD1|nr:chaperone protein [Cryptococcus neoformans var. grubii H99]XP_024511855.1 chaperone, putative [Cryptococcus neoformans var. neoformans JEC21]AUB21790.1 chaperone protein [Cryptococcus neoformans var. grubii]OWT41869.1 chaperone protein [Cryptococcus neoformans var. grubii Bt1]OWZ36953.1 chaperone protein [Cryptococcus neoformans var. grubii AD2-60a]OWZ48784.1 chaperone protein [Cryptococcus neoformans var. grubii C23]OWZ58717.1 chaperone protein [Cryptococcus neoformans var. grubii 125.91]|eukprot:XP_012046218.1 chaperone protein [Cryptococcus neoformans var. grubii H99]
MASPLVVGLGLLGAGLAGRVGYQMMRASRGGAQEFLKGGFKAKMDRSEAIQVLGLREPITSNKLKDAHRRLMLANHPDRGGAPYLAGKVNEAKALLDKEVVRR